MCVFGPCCFNVSLLVERGTHKEEDQKRKKG